MKTYEVKVGEYSGFTNVKLEIPDEVYFFYNEGEVGGGLSAHSQHYHTIVKTSNYKSWIKKICTYFGINVEEIGDYTIITINSLSNDSVIPTIDREEWFEQNNINLSQYIIVNRDGNYNIVNAYRIHEFISPWTIKEACVTRRDYFSAGEYWSMSEECRDLDTILISSNNGHSEIRSKVIKGEEAETLWNTMIHNVISKVGYDANKVDENYDFDKDKNDLIAILRDKGWNDVADMVEKNNI